MSVLAEYHGQCAECLEPIIPGQRIHSVDGEWQHASCGARPETAPCVCSDCFLVHAPMRAVCW